MAEGTGRTAAIAVEPSEQAWDLPRGWQWRRLGDLINRRLGKVLPSDNPKLPFLGLEGIAPGTLDVVDTVPLGSMRSAASSFKQGDVLYGRLRPYLNKVWAARYDGACSGEFFALLPDPALSAAYLAYYLHSQHFVFFASHAVTGDRPRIDFDEIAAFAIPIPPLSVQHRIIARIEELFAEIAEGENALADARAGLDTYRKSLLRAAFVGDLTAEWRKKHLARLTRAEYLQQMLEDRRRAWTEDAARSRRRYIEPVCPEAGLLPEIPDTWVWASLQQITFISGGITVDRKRKPGDPVEVPYLRVANVQRGYIDLEKVKTIFIERDELDSLALRPGDILLNEGGDRDKIGRGWVWEGQLPMCVHQNHVFKARPSTNNIVSQLVSLYLNEMGRKFFLDEGKQTTNLASISLSKVARAPVPVPPYDEAEAILAAFADVSGSETERDEFLQPTVSASSTLRQSILGAAFRGELVQ